MRIPGDIWAVVNESHEVMCSFSGQAAEEDAKAVILIEPGWKAIKYTIAPSSLRKLWKECKDNENSDNV